MACLVFLARIDRKLLEGNRAHVAVYFQNDFFGLSYSASNQEIIDFFQKVDLARPGLKRSPD